MQRKGPLDGRGGQRDGTKGSKIGEKSDDGRNIIGRRRDKVVFPKSQIQLQYQSKRRVNQVIGSDILTFACLLSAISSVPASVLCSL